MSVNRLIGGAAARFPSGALWADPTRTIEALAVGISFMGAGTIFQDRSGTAMKGLTTAAGLLAAASIGIAVASQSLCHSVRDHSHLSLRPAHIGQSGKAIEAQSTTQT